MKNKNLKVAIEELLEASRRIRGTPVPEKDFELIDSLSIFVLRVVADKVELLIKKEA
jgi:hypothetical protein